jgi:hypothetical protein
MRHVARISNSLSPPKKNIFKFHCTLLKKGAVKRRLFDLAFLENAVT